MDPDSRWVYWNTRAVSIAVADGWRNSNEVAGGKRENLIAKQKLKASGLNEKGLFTVSVQVCTVVRGEPWVMLGLRRNRPLKKIVCAAAGSGRYNQTNQIIADREDYAVVSVHSANRPLFSC